MNAAATKCRVLLSYKPSGMSHEDEESIHRVFWSCFILERLSRSTNRNLCLG
jgi:hypothetical protein